MIVVHDGLDGTCAGGWTRYKYLERGGTKGRRRK